jgi:hypothetical protein
MQFRPKGDPGASVYAPQRDLAYVYPAAMKEALRALDPDKMPAEIKDLCAKLSVTNDHICAGVQAILAAHRLFVNDPEVETALDALIKGGWYDVRPAVRYLIFGRLGEVILGGFFLALRDISRLDDESAQQREIADFIAVGRLLLYRLGGDTPPEPTDWREEAIARHEELALQRQSIEALKRRLERRTREDAATIKALGEVVDDYRFEGVWRGVWRLLTRWTTP